MKALLFTRAAALAGFAATATIVLAGAAGIASAAPRTALSSSAADPLAGTFSFKVGYGNSPRTLVIAATGTGLTVTTQESFRSQGTPSPGTQFLVIDRTYFDQADTDPASCTVPAGAVLIGGLRYTATDALGVRHYTGAGLKAVGAVESPHTCSLVGLVAPLYVTLGRHGDTADKDGPYNGLCWNQDSPTANSCSTALTRLAGTWSATATTPATLATPATTSTTPKGLVPWYARWYRDKRFATDRVAPVIRALPSSGRRGLPFTLSYESTDNSGFAGESYRIYRGSTLIKAWAVMAGERDGRIQQAPATLPQTVSGKLTFCVGGADLNGNRTGWNCATLTIS